MTHDTTLIERARRFIAKYWPGSRCRRDRCEFYRPSDPQSGSSPSCWLRHGVGAAGREPECGAFQFSTHRKNETPWRRGPNCTGAKATESHRRYVARGAARRSL